MRKNGKAPKEHSRIGAERIGRKAIKDKRKILEQFGTFDFDPKYKYKAERRRKRS